MQERQRKRVAAGKARERAAEEEEEEATAMTGKRTASSRSSATTSTRKRRKTDAAATTATPSNTKERAPTLKDNLLEMKTGPLADRLNRNLGHWTMRLDERGARCAVHRWCAGIEVKADVYKCSHCRINLCVECFPIFHQKIDLVGYKDELKRKYVAEKEKADDQKSTATQPAKKSKK